MKIQNNERHKPKQASENTNQERHKPKQASENTKQRASQTQTSVWKYKTMSVTNLNRRLKIQNNERHKPKWASENTKQWASETQTGVWKYKTTNARTEIVGLKKFLFNFDLDAADLESVLIRTAVGYVVYVIKQEDSD